MGLGLTDALSILAHHRALLLHVPTASVGVALEQLVLVAEELLWHAHLLRRVDALTLLTRVPALLDDFPVADGTFAPLNVVHVAPPFTNLANRRCCIALSTLAPVKAQVTVGPLALFALLHQVAVASGLAVLALRRLGATLLFEEAAATAS